MGSFYAEYNDLDLQDLMEKLVLKKKLTRNNERVDVEKKETKNENGKTKDNSK